MVQQDGHEEGTENANEKKVEPVVAKSSKRGSEVGPWLSLLFVYFVVLE